MQALRIKEEEERLKALPPKERDDAKKFFSKATGALEFSFLDHGAIPSFLREQFSVTFERDRNASAR